MAFWHNSRYEDVEKSSTGDPMRGLPHKKFPWHLGYSIFKDNINDEWHYELSCLAISPDKNNNKVRATIFMIAESQVSKINLKQMGISSERLDFMDVVSWNYLEEKYTCEIICEFDKIEHEAKKMTEKWINLINKKYTLEIKNKILSEKIRSSRLSAFSE